MATHSIGRDALGAVLGAIDSGVAVLDAQQRVVFWNGWLEAASRIDSSRAAGRALAELFPGTAGGRLLSVVADAFVVGTTSILTHALNPGLLPLRAADGRPIAHNTIVRSVNTEDGIVCLIQVIDVSASVERERVLRERQNARYRAVVDTAADAIVTTGLDGTIQWANAAAERQFGFDRGAMIGREIGSVLDHRGAWPTRAPGDARPSSQLAVEVRGRRQDGVLVPMEMSATSWASDGRTFVTGILRDITDRKRAEDALRAAAAVSSSISGTELLQALVRELAQGLGVSHAYVAEFADNGRRRLRTRAIWGYGAIADPLEYPVDGTPCADAIAAGLVAVRSGIRARYPDSSMLASVGAESFVGVCMSDSAGNPLGIVAVLDESPLPDSETAEMLVATFAARVAGELERQRAEEALRRLNAELERRVEQRTRALTDAAAELKSEMKRREEMQATLLQSQKLEALGQLVGGVAHDFNNVLAAILGSYMLVERRVSDPSVHQLLAHGRKAAERAAELIRHLLAFARREELTPRPVSLATLLPGVRDLLGHAAGSGVRCEFDVSADLWPVLVDQHRLEVALLNLAVNARDAMPSGGTVTMTARNLTIADGADETLRPGDYVSIVMADNGCGMPTAVLARATEPFFTTKGVGEGTGLGLAMVHGFVEQSGGRLSIDSREGEGTRIEILLPRAAAVARPSVPRPARVAAAHCGGGILVVDDDDQVRPVAAMFLRDLGYEVFEAASAEAALAIALTASRLELVLSDVVMPGADGPTLARRVRSERPELPFLFMTGHADRRMLAGELVIEKPFDSGELADRVVEAIGRRAVTPEAAGEP